MNPIHPKDKKEMEPTHTLIFLHGIGSSSNQIFTKFNDLGFVPAGFRVILPMAPVRKLKCVNGKNARSWFQQEKMEDREMGDFDHQEVRKHVDQESLIEASE